MYYYLNGDLSYLDVNIAVIDCGGVGYKLTISSLTSAKLVSYTGKKVKLFTHLSVREDGIELYGFISEDEKNCFMRLTSVSGVGPKVAIGILSTLPPENLVYAIESEDQKAIARSPGVGSKTAARIILELKDKIGADVTIQSTNDQSVNLTAGKSKNIVEATEALISLGYDRSTVLSAIKAIDPNEKEVGDIIRMALKKLSR